MRKVYIKFGEFEGEGFEDIYQGLLEGNIVKVVIPEASYTYCQKLAAHWGDEKVYLLNGEEVADTINGGVSLVNTEILGELTRDEKTQGYYCSDALKWKLDHTPVPQEKIEYEKGFFGFINRIVDFWRL